MTTARHSVSRIAGSATQSSGSPREYSNLFPSSDSVARAVFHLLPPLMSPVAEHQDVNGSPVASRNLCQGTESSDTIGEHQSQATPSPRCLNASRIRRALVAFSGATSPEESRKRTRSHASEQAQSDESIVECPGTEVTAAPAPSRRVSQKVSRACDFCKQRKARCTGTLPCDKCTRKGLECKYNSSYSRGRPPTPPPSTSITASNEVDPPAKHQSDPVKDCTHPDLSIETSILDSTSLHQVQTCHGNGAYLSDAQRANDGPQPVSRASPELGMTEIEGQVFDPTSGVQFMHRAWKRLSKSGADHSTSPGSLAGHPRIEDQPYMLAGDLPLPCVTDTDVERLALPPLQDAKRLLGLYFETCIVTYRILHPPSVESWLTTTSQNISGGRVLYHQIGRARTSILLAVLAIATAHDEKKLPTFTQTADDASVARSDYLYCISQKLAEDETGPPLLESAQARLLQVMYLLLSSRMNQAWYTFGNALQIISALGLHRKSAKKGAAVPDYRQTQLRVRTFWTAYILDKYLGVIFGRPRHYHDEDIDQVYPDRVEDEDIGTQSAVNAGGQDCHVDALICHAKIARIVGAISREVYSIKPVTEEERCISAHRLSKQLHEWRASLPPHLGTIRPSMLIRSFRRQSQVLQLAYCHAIMHANRLFLLGSPSPDSQAQAMECVQAAQTVLEAVDRMAVEGPWIQAFWFTQYVAFHALVITYVWDIQRRRWGLAARDQTKHTELMALAGRCQAHLAHATASNSPSRRYAVILEEFRSEALGPQLGPKGDDLRPWQYSDLNGYQHSHGQQPALLPSLNGLNTTVTSATMSSLDMAEGTFGSTLLDEWQTTDWLDLDSSAFGLYMDVEPDSSCQWMPDLES